MDKLVLSNYNIDYDGAVTRFMGNHELYERLLLEFIYENEFEEAEIAIKNSDYEAAYKYIHNMKGITGNLSINSLYWNCCKVIDLLLEKDYKNISASFDKLMKTYQEISRGIKKASEG